MASIVHIVEYELNNPGFGFWQRQEILLFSKVTRPTLGAHPASYSMGNGSLPWEKWPRHEADYYLHLVLRLSAAIQIFPQYIHGICKENFTFYPVLLSPENQSQKGWNILVMVGKKQDI
jgi:hypothetical protein